MASPSRFVWLPPLVLVLAAGCATSNDWETWRSHPSHFATGDHLAFSVRNTSDASPAVRRSDINAARSQAWWGRPVTVAEGQILER